MVVKHSNLGEEKFWGTVRVRLALFFGVPLLISNLLYHGMPTQSILNSAFFYRGKTNCGCGTHAHSPPLFLKPESL
uniref:Uncharacterized protein n=1 Tax=Anguilla anguilla TaxID=7936 RepID=A0A0E9X2W1_ANGAN